MSVNNYTKGATTAVTDDKRDMLKKKERNICSVEMFWVFEQLAAFDSKASTVLSNNLHKTYN